MSVCTVFGLNLLVTYVFELHTVPTQSYKVRRNQEIGLDAFQGQV